jgi:hypothetical protein
MYPTEHLDSRYASHPTTFIPHYPQPSYPLQPTPIYPTHHSKPQLVCHPALTMPNHLMSTAPQFVMLTDREPQPRHRPSQFAQPHFPDLRSKRTGGFPNLISHPRAQPLPPSPRAPFIPSSYPLSQPRTILVMRTPSPEGIRVVHPSPHHHCHMHTHCDRGRSPTWTRDDSESDGRIQSPSLSPQPQEPAVFDSEAVRESVDEALWGLKRSWARAQAPRARRRSRSSTPLARRSRSRSLHREGEKGRISKPRHRANRYRTPSPHPNHVRYHG